MKSELEQLIELFPSNQDKHFLEICLSDLLRWRDEIVHLSEEITRLQNIIDLWKDRWEAERRDHEATIKAADDALGQWSE